MLSRTTLAIFAALAATTAGAAPIAKAPPANVERGRYLVTILGCNDCHSPKSGPASMMPDMSRMLSGHPPSTPVPSKPANMGEITASGDLTAWYGPWGISYASNLTPDAKTGIGKRYTEASFIKTLRTGKKPEGEDLLPPMPWPDFAQMNDADLKAIYAFLRTLKPIENNVRMVRPGEAKKKKH